MQFAFEKFLEGIHLTLCSDEIWKFSDQFALEPIFKRLDFRERTSFTNRKTRGMMLVSTTLLVSLSVSDEGGSQPNDRVVCTKA